MLIRNNDNDLKLTTNPTVVIQQQDNNSNQHARRMSHKTLGRELPISQGLASLLIEYIEEDRPLLRKPTKGVDAVFIRERKDGGPMTTDGLNYVLDSLFRRTPELKQVVHPHSSA